MAYIFNSCEELISVEHCESNSLVVFDDCVNIQQQQTVKAYFVTGSRRINSCICSDHGLEAVESGPNPTAPLVLRKGERIPTVTDGPFGSSRR